MVVSLNSGLEIIKKKKRRDLDLLSEFGVAAVDVVVRVVQLL